MDIVKKFSENIQQTLSSGHAREHSYRPALKELFEEITELKVINEPKRSEYGAPDFVFLKNTSSKEKIILAYAEAKDINVNLDEIEKSEQMDRYYGYSNIILTNGLDFRFYKNTSKYSDSIVIGKLNGQSIDFNNDNFQLLNDTLKDFIGRAKEPIKSGNVLAKIMAGKARRIRDNIRKYLKEEDDFKNQNLLEIYEIIQKLLLSDLDKDKFADMYSQTLVYGLFVARYYDQTNDTFSRQEARDLVPASNPFLRHFFDHIAGANFDPRIEIIVDELCEEFTHADVKAIINNYYKVEKDSSRDPIIHFYEDFLQEYDSSERKKMGVFYTPLPVVQFIVRAVDDILKTEFNLEKGLADNSKIEITKTVQGKKAKEKIHKVQILDPATGTGTFLNETILHIKKSFAGQEGVWNSYINNDLLPRLHGFELMMASYTIAHLKLSSTVLESGAKIDPSSRLGIYLTNSLEKQESNEQTLFNIGLGKAITEESDQANKIKNEMPVMVVLGNPPYSGESSNANYSEQDEYKKEFTGEKLKERNSKWINDDYVKFIRFSESLIEKNGEGVVGMITAHGYIDNPTFRGMRHHLMQTFDKIYIVDLHGNARKKEVSPDGSKDENVFNIMTGVSIILGIKKSTKNNKLAKIYKTDFYGKRENKFNLLKESDLNNIEWKEIKITEPNFEWIHKNVKKESEYKNGFSLNKIFPLNGVGITTAHDGFVIDFSKENLFSRFESFKSSDRNIDYLHERFNVKKKKGWDILKGYDSLFKEKDIVNYIKDLSYRPFDNRYIFYEDNLVWRTVRRTLVHMLKENIGLTFARTQKEEVWNAVFITKFLMETKFSERSTQSAISPLYLYHEDGTKVPNLDKEIWNKINELAGETAPENILDYIYAVLHSPNYREKYKEFLKIDFPRIPYPKDKKEFFDLVKLGKELRELHLLESSKVNNFITTFPESGEDVVDKKYPKYIDGNVYINEKQYFGNVPEIAWNFYIGGYQPAQKWLKDRKERKLTSEDISHYQKMIVSLVETDRIMGEIGEVI